MNKKLVLTIVRETAKIYLQEHQIISASNDLPDWLLKNKFAVYITAYDYNNNVRSRAGYHIPKQTSVAKEIITNTINCVKGIGKYKPILLTELPGLKFKIDIIVESIICSTIDKINPRKEGLLVLPKTKKVGIIFPPQTSLKIMLSLACRQALVDQLNDLYSLYRLKIKQFSE
jgi:AMMECR1 domain-containing protein